MNNTYEDLVKKMTRIKQLYSLKEEDVFEILLTSKALLLNGHFQLLSKLHTDSFFRFALISRFPWLMKKISLEMLGWIKESGIHQIDVVLSTSRAGKCFAYEIAKELNSTMSTRAVFSKSDPITGYPMKELLPG
jgi:orotate phosphoribosyltransferase